MYEESLICLNQKISIGPQETGSSQTPLRLPMSPMSEYRGLFDEAISQRDRKQRDKWRILAKPDGMFAGILQ